MYAVRRIRNLAKLRSQFGDICNQLMYASCLLLKKGMLLNQNAINSLKTKTNVFNLSDFDKFTE